MLITESQLSHSINALNLLENMTYLNESESNYHPAMVPVVENTTIGKNIIYVRGLMEMTGSMNDGESFAQAICEVLDANQLETSSSILAVDEASVYEHPEILSFIEYCGMDTAVLPISDKDIVYQYTEAVVNEAYETGDMGFLLEFLGSDFIKNKVTKHLEDKPNWVKNAAGIVGNSAIHYGLKQGTLGVAKATLMTMNPILAAGTVALALASDLKLLHNLYLLGKSIFKGSGEGQYYDNTVKTTENIIKNLASKPDSWASKKLASINKQIEKWSAKAKSSTDPKKQNAINKLLEGLHKTKELLIKKLSSKNKKPAEK